VCVHADSLDEPFDINSGAQLILGSTAKFRTLVTYLNVVTALHDRYADRPKAELIAEEPGRDPLTAWAMTWLAQAPDHGLRRMLDAAMQRRYSAPPGAFFTNGGLHQFHNFETWEDTTRPTVAEAFENSINLVYVRLMRDIRGYFIAQNNDAVRVMADPSDAVREAYLRRFADHEGRKFVDRFYRQYRNLNAAAVWALVVRHGRTGIDRRVTLFRSLRPLGSVAELSTFLAAYVPSMHTNDEELHDLYAKYAPDRFSVSDQAYIADVHPLEIAVVSYLLDHPGAAESEVQSQTALQRQEAYAWLFKTHSRANHRRRSLSGSTPNVTSPIGRDLRQRTDHRRNWLCGRYLKKNPAVSLAERGQSCPFSSEGNGRVHRLILPYSKLHGMARPLRRERVRQPFRLARTKGQVGPVRVLRRTTNVRLL
jgi:membrane peptidoglycan carboxypeptidase